MKNFATITCFILSGILLFSFKVSKKDRMKNATLAGVWITINSGIPNAASHMKVFEESGNYYNVGFEKGVTIITHKGTFKILDEKNYQENVTNARFNGAWDLKGRSFTNRYELSKDNQRLILNGIVFSKDGGDSLRWTEHYKRVQIPE